MPYWDRKEELKKHAKEFNEYLELNCRRYIEISIAHSRIYGPNPVDIPDYIVASNSRSIFIKYYNGTSIDCIRRCYSSKMQNDEWKDVALLNFASYKNAGGKFINGSSAQEESICHNTTLYPVLTGINSYYNWNRSNLNRGLYLNRALFSPYIGMDFVGDKPYCFANIITCAAPNKTAFTKRFTDISSDNDINNFRALRSRVQFIIDICTANEIKYLVAGAFGTGVFGQDLKEVAIAFKEAIPSSKTLEEVYFPVPEKDKLNVMRTILADSIKRVG